MKKILLALAFASMMATGAFAQMSVVKEAAKLVGSNDPQKLMEAFNKLQPALTNPESAQNAETWYLAGKCAFGLYDQLSIMKQMQEGQGQQSDIPAEQLADMLMGGFELMRTALPLDSVKETNKDGSLKLDKNGQPKVKTKYSKEITDIMGSHISDVLTFAGDCINNQKYEPAAKAYNNFFELLDSEVAHKANVQLSPEDYAQTKFFQGFAQYYSKDYENAYKNISTAVAGGYTENNAAEYKASALDNILLAKANAGDYAAAIRLIDEVLATEPGNAHLYDMKGSVIEMEKGYKAEGVIECYKKAVELDPENADANYNYGRMFYNQAAEAIDANPTASTAQLVPIVKPFYEQALPYLQKAASLNNENITPQAKRLLDDIDYKYEQMGLKK